MPTQVDDQLLQQGLDLMLFGMGTVFVFLSLLVISTVLMSSFINRFFPVGEGGSPSPESPVLANGDNKVPKPIKAAITLALQQHRAKYK